MKGAYAAVLSPKPEGGYLCSVPDLPGCVTSGRDLEEAMDMVADAAHEWLCDGDHDRKELPEASAMEAIPREKHDLCIWIRIDTDAFRHGMVPDQCIILDERKNL